MSVFYKTFYRLKYILWLCSVNAEVHTVPAVQHVHSAVGENHIEYTRTQIDSTRFHVAACSVYAEVQALPTVQHGHSAVGENHIDSTPTQEDY